ncbi:hypothetical protein WMY93_014834 [Mugilogobius chulae]|uniref:Uncharacterized protein n=1 Tax=Mugilogobius chulae TaxID=88201 RepID=A0AAW0P2A3_9GOBI
MNSVNVGIKNVVPSDSGLYRCEIRSDKWKVEFKEFQLKVISDHFSTTIIPSTGRYVSTNAHVRRQDNPSPEQSYLYVILVVALAAALILLLVVLSILCWRKRVNRQKASESKEHAQILETELYENVRAVRASADDTYQSLCVDTMDPNQIYSSI